MGCQSILDPTLYALEDFLCLHCTMQHVHVVCRHLCDTRKYMAWCVQQARPADRRTQDNSLVRETPFVANIRFRNTLPELPCDPKLLVKQHDPEALSRFQLTNAEENLRPELVLAQDPAVLSAMHMQKYCYSGNAGDLHPDDRALIEGQMGARAQRGNVAWLMKTRCCVLHLLSWQAEGTRLVYTLPLAHTITQLSLIHI